MSPFRSCCGSRQQYILLAVLNRTPVRHGHQGRYSGGSAPSRQTRQRATEHALQVNCRQVGMGRRQMPRTHCSDCSQANECQSLRGAHQRGNPLCCYRPQRLPRRCPPPLSLSLSGTSQVGVDRQGASFPLPFKESRPRQSVGPVPTPPHPRSGEAQDPASDGSVPAIVHILCRGRLQPGHCGAG